MISAWVGTITSICTADGSLYLVNIIDLCSRRVVGWSIAEPLGIQWMLTVLSGALGHRRPGKSGLVFHSD